MRFILCVLALFIFAGPEALAEERITRFISDATVRVDGAVEVTETITVVSEGNEIRRGILRDFPTTYINPNSTRVVVGFDVQSVRRDGQNENYTQESLSNGRRIRIGSADILLPSGQHVYEIKYVTTRQIGFFLDYDELYWNATGNGWTFPIDTAKAIVRLPTTARILQHEAYTAAEGEAGRDFRVLNADGNIYEVETTRRFRPGEGLTIAVAWQKGIVIAPSDSQRVFWFLGDNAGIVGLVLTLLVVAFYFIWAWRRVGRDPPRGTIIPLFSPPAALSPAATRFIWKQRFDSKGFASALVGLAVKGRLKIMETGKHFEIQQTRASKGPPLTLIESELLRAIPSGPLVLEKSNHADVSRMKNALENSLQKEFEGAAFVRNIRWFWGGAALSFVGLILSAVFLPNDEGVTALFAAFWAAIWWTGVLGASWGMISNLSASRGFIRKMGAAASFLFIIPFVIAGTLVPAVLAFSDEFSSGVASLIITAVGLGALNMLFNYLLRAPTVSGQKLLNQIEGFRMYMKTAEEDRLNVLNPPEKTPELFQKYLPYALALDCENEWNAKFTAVLAAAAVTGAAAPLWYSGTHWNTNNLDDFTDSVGSSLASSAASAAVAPGSRSSSGGGFSGGGGSSGGGGGGGGGSGW